MPIINPPQGGQARSIHVQQIINWLRGLPTYSEAVSLTGLTSNSAYSLTVGNRGTGGLGFAVKDSSLTRTLFEAKEAGVIVRPNAGTGTFFRVRNFADNADLFAVTDAGVTLGGDTIVTLTAAQNLTDKTLTGPLLASARVTDYTDVTQAAAPANPPAGRLRAYSVIGNDTLRFRNSIGTEFTLADTSSVQALSQKSLNSPTLNGAVVSDYAEVIGTVAPAQPAAGRWRTYIDSGDSMLKLLANGGGSRTVITTTDTQTMTNKTLTSPTLTTPSETGPVIGDYSDYVHAAAPAGAASKTRLWAKNDNQMYMTIPSGATSQILTSSNTPITSSLSLARPLMLSGG